jgi:rRNA processing protein Krr1/Pno1
VVDTPQTSVTGHDIDMSDIERVELTDQDVAYLVGRGGATRMRLEKFSGARLNIDRDCAEVQGLPNQRELAKLAIAITLQQRNGGKVQVDFDDLEDRSDVSTFDVPKETVGFLLGAKGTPASQLSRTTNALACR